MTKNERKNIIAHRIRQERKKLGCSQAEFAERLNCCLSTITKWESTKNGRMPSLEILSEMCDMFNCDMGYLLGDYTYKKFENDCLFKGIELPEELLNKLKEYTADCRADKEFFSELGMPSHKNGSPLVITIVQQFIDDAPELRDAIANYYLTKNTKEKLKKDNNADIIIAAFEYADNTPTHFFYPQQRPLTHSCKEVIFEKKLEELLAERLPHYKQETIYKMVYQYYVSYYSFLDRKCSVESSELNLIKQLLGTVKKIEDKIPDNN